MLAGKQLGEAIEKARISKGISKKQLADEFGVKPPSVKGLVRDGRIDKKRLVMMHYFGDVVGPEHWVFGDIMDAEMRAHPLILQIAKGIEDGRLTDSDNELPAPESKIADGVSSTLRWGLFANGDNSLHVA
jgi:transcriptional regulator with XRE-family HTH domain